MAITAQKFLPQGKTGGNLAVTPKTSLIKSSFFKFLFSA